MNLDTAITAMSALMIVMLVPSGRYLGLISYLLDLTSSQAVVMGWAPLVSASFLFIWACNWVGAIIPWSFIEIPSGELAANVTTFLALPRIYLRWLRRYLKPVAFLFPLNILEEFSKPLSLSFRLFGNILADELTLSVL